MRWILLCAALFCVSPLHADTIRSKSGVTAHVAAGTGSAFQCVVDKIEATGYRIKFMRGFGHGTVRGSKHPSGYAIDINQIARNVTTPRLPAGTTSMAASCGVFHGAQWRNADAGHFEISSGRREYSARRKRRR